MLTVAAGSEVDEVLRIAPTETVVVATADTVADDSLTTCAEQLTVLLADTVASPNHSLPAKLENGAWLSALMPNIYTTVQTEPEGTVTVTPESMVTGPADIAFLPVLMVELCEIVASFSMYPLAPVTDRSAG